MYRIGLEGTGFELPFRNGAGQPAYHIFPALLPAGADRKAFIDAMRLAGVQTSIHYPPIHKFSYYRRRYGEKSLPLTEDVASREVTLPLYPSMDTDQIGIVVSAVKSALDKAQNR
jgi:dTDP-4-amino-4,6-dideoxygalactose transaminase